MAFQRGKYTRQPPTAELLEAREDLKKARKQAKSHWRISIKTQQKLAQAKQIYALTRRQSLHSKIEELESRVKQQKEENYALRKAVSECAGLIVEERRRATVERKRVEIDAVAEEYRQTLESGEENEFNEAVEEFRRSWKKGRAADLRHRQADYRKNLLKGVKKQQQQIKQKALGAMREERQKFSADYVEMKQQYGLGVGLDSAEAKRLKQQEKVKLYKSELRRVEAQRKRLQARLQDLD